MPCRALNLVEDQNMPEPADYTALCDQRNVVESLVALRFLS